MASRALRRERNARLGPPFRPPSALECVGSGNGADVAGSFRWRASSLLVQPYLGLPIREMKLLHVVGARPNFPKLTPVHRAGHKIGLSQVVVHTGQH
jgi:hypothetical protein